VQKPKLAPEGLIDATQNRDVIPNRAEGAVRNLLSRDHEPLPLQGTAGSSHAFSAHRNDKILKMGG
jgi:hypothetical protein